MERPIDPVTTITLTEGTVVHVHGTPVHLLHDTDVSTAPSNAAQLMKSLPEASYKTVYTP